VILSGLPILDRDEPKQDVRRCLFSPMAQFHNLASPRCAGPLRSAMNNSETDISLVMFGLGAARAFTRRFVGPIYVKDLEDYSD
jgi:hypothetical protein